MRVWVLKIAYNPRFAEAWVAGWDRTENNCVQWLISFYSGACSPASKEPNHFFLGIEKKIYSILPLTNRVAHPCESSAQSDLKSRLHATNASQSAHVTSLSCQRLAITIWMWALGLLGSLNWAQRPHTSVKEWTCTQNHTPPTPCMNGGDYVKSHWEHGVGMRIYFDNGACSSATKEPRHLI